MRIAFWAHGTWVPGLTAGVMEQKRVNETPVHKLEDINVQEKDKVWKRG